MKKAIAILSLMLAFGLANAQKNQTPAADNGSGNAPATTVSGTPAPANNARGTRGKSTPIIAKTAQPGSTTGDETAPDNKEGLKTQPAAAPAPAAKPAKSGK